MWQMICTDCGQEFNGVKTKDVFKTDCDCGGGKAMLTHMTKQPEPEIPEIVEVVANKPEIPPEKPICNTLPPLIGRGNVTPIAVVARIRALASQKMSSRAISNSLFQEGTKISHMTVARILKRKV